MSFCPKCGREIIDESLGCPICGVKENTRPETTQADDQPAEKVNSFTVEDAKGTYQKFESTENTSGGTWASGGTNTAYQNNQHDNNDFQGRMDSLFIDRLIFW